MRLRFKATALSLLVLATIAGVPVGTRAAFAVTGSCGPSSQLGTKQIFVEDRARRLGNDGGTATGVMGNLYAFDRELTCAGWDGGPQNWAITFLHFELSSPVEPRAFLEGGYMYFPDDPRPKITFIQEDHNLDPPLYIYVSGPRIHPPTNAWYAFNISPHYYYSGQTASFKLQYSPGESQTGWTTWGVSNIAFDRYGIPLVEMERTFNTYTNGNTGNGKTFARDLKYRPTSGWFDWVDMRCGLDYITSENEWRVHKFNHQDFYTENVPPATSGSCF